MTDSASDSIAARLAELGIQLPEPAAPVAAYVPAVEIGGFLYISGQLPFREDGSLITGRLGEDVDLAHGQLAAERCAPVRASRAARVRPHREQPRGLPGGDRGPARDRAGCADHRRCAGGRLP